MSFASTVGVAVTGLFVLNFHFKFPSFFTAHTSPSCVPMQIVPSEQSTGEECVREPRSSPHFRVPSKLIAYNFPVTSAIYITPLPIAGEASILPSVRNFHIKPPSFLMAYRCLSQEPT